MILAQDHLSISFIIIIIVMPIIIGASLASEVLK